MSTATHALKLDIKGSYTQFIVNTNKLISNMRLLKLELAFNNPSNGSYTLNKDSLDVHKELLEQKCHDFQKITNNFRQTVNEMRTKLETISPNDYREATHGNANSLDALDEIIDGMDEEFNRVLAESEDFN